MGFAVGYQKSVDDPFGDRFRIFKKPKSLTLETKEGFKQKVKLENVKGMQYPVLQVSLMRLVLKAPGCLQLRQSHRIWHFRFQIFLE